MHVSIIQYEYIGYKMYRTTFVTQNLTYFLLPDNHSLPLKVDSHKTLVGGNTSSWKNAVFTLGTVNEIGSIVVLLSLKALANSTSRTLHTFFERNENPWCNPRDV